MRSSASVALPPSYAMSTRVLSPDVKSLECETDHSPPSSTDDKEWHTVL